jgi:hypothetical protein
MDGKMKGMIMAGMMALSLILGAMAIFSNEWLTEEEDEKGTDQTTNNGLSNQEWILKAESSEECDMGKEFYEAMFEDATVECDGAVLTMTIAISDLCEVLDEMEAESDDIEDCEAAASAGTMGTIGMWAGVVCALVATLMLVLPMAGVDAMDAIPDMGKMIVTWGAGGLMLLGMLLWYFMLPDGDSSMGLHLWLAGAAMTIGLGAAATGQFIPADE